MSGYTRSFRRGLTFRVVAGVLAFVLGVGFALFLVVANLVDDFIQAGVESDLQALSRDVYNLGDGALDGLLRKGRAGNPLAVRVEQGKTIGVIADFLRENHIEGLLVADGKEALRSRGLATLPLAQWRKLPERRVALHEEGRSLFVYRFQFEPWGWEIYLAKESHDYLHLLVALRSAYGYTAALLLLGTLVLLYYMQRNVRRPVEAIISSLRAGAPPGYRGVHEFEFLARHIAEMMEDLQRKSREAEQASRAKSAFLANMSHEIRTPMNGVLGMLQLMETTHLDDEQRDYVATARGSAQQQLRIINDILDFSKIEAGQLQLERLPVDLAAVVDEVVNIVGKHGRERGLTVETAIAPDTPRRVLADPTRLRQLLTNLVGNAVKFTERGEVKVAVSVAPEGVLFEVRDSGIGIDAETQRMLFRPFTQADESMTRRFGGTGLGLAICRELVEAMGGEIGVESVVGEGARFWFRLPLEEAPPETPPAEPTGGPSTGALAGRVLLVEDNSLNQKVGLGLLTRLGVEVEIATDGAQAVERVAAGHYDAILMDVQMPVMDGHEATRRIRLWELERGLPRTPIIALTAASFEGDREACFDAGMDDYLAKPFQFQELAETLSTWLKGR